MIDQNFWKEHARQAAVLSPIDRIAEVLFGLIMVLTFTGAISVATDGREEIGELLWAALGCNVAWGLVDAIMYLMNVAVERGHAITVFNKLANAKTIENSRSIIKDELDPLIISLMTDEEVDKLNDRLRKLPAPVKKHVLTVEDLKSGFQIFLLVFFCTLPVALPFVFLTDIELALRVSNGLALVMLFIGGYLLAGYAGFRKILTAAAYTAVGVFLVAITMALGG